MKYSKKKPVIVMCSGEAHENPFIDNCPVCMPYWEEIMTCPECGKKLRITDKSFICDDCKIGYKD